MPAPVLLAPLALAVTLVWAGLAKRGVRQDTARAVRELRVPGWLAGPAMVAALPWVEVGLGVGLVVLPAPWTLVAALPALVLMLAYVVLVGRVLRAGRDVSCGCFGAAGEDRVTRATLARNLVLLAAAALTVVDGVSGESAVGRLLELSGEQWLWLTGVALVALLVALVVGVGERRSADHRSAGLALGSVTEEQRAGIPYLVVTDSDGQRISLPELASLRPQLLVALSPTCGSCRTVSEVIAEWPGQVPEIDVHVVTRAGVGEPLPDRWPSSTLHDPADDLLRVLGLVRPSAMLLGADALVVAGPVHGAEEVLALFEEVRDALAESRQAPDSAPSTRPSTGPVAR